MNIETTWENAPAVAGHKSLMSDGYDFSALRVLVVDDSFHMRELVRTFLEGFGIKEVTVSSDAEEAFDFLVNMDPDLIITDWNMAPVSGLEFVERIRKSANVPNRFVPIIMLTGYTEMKRVEEARDAGINSFLAKPISAASLYKRLVTSVQDKRQYVESSGGYFGPDRRAGKRREYRGKERREKV
ncbi:MAG: two-component system response regulator [Rhodospirillales bacterium CG15_BIG_FIL_POST_REV_8_21_14_020_66_15]|nr:MAG: two-component system response regulator [Rhodospirillales bacterium CG15_BIG_FIL_POST_REV_8_21_14_020_66_15]